MPPWWQRLFPWRRGAQAASALRLPRVDRQDIGPLLCFRHGLPQVDWGMASAWLNARHPDDEPLMRRAVVAAWLEELRDTLEADHQAWRRDRIEGLTPLDGSLGRRVVATAEHSLRELTRLLEPIRGVDPIPNIAIVGLKPRDAYLSFMAHFMPEQGEWATSGGFYIRSSQDSFPLLAMNLSTNHSTEVILAHELTHHALAPCNLPLWAEEGLTQMMEERVVGVNNFMLDGERVAKQRERWAGSELQVFIRGDGYLSPMEEDQTLAYHLSQWVVRRALDERPKEFFAFLRACRSMAADEACERSLGCSPEEFVRAITGIPEVD